MVDQTGYREPHDFIGNPPGQDPLGTVVDQKGPWGTIGQSMADQTGPWKNKWDHGGPYRTIGGQYGTLKDPLP